MLPFQSWLRRNRVWSLRPSGNQGQVILSWSTGLEYTLFCVNSYYCLRVTWSQGNVFGIATTLQGGGSGNLCPAGVGHFLKNFKADFGANPASHS